jgi:hypothetical protein
MDETQTLAAQALRELLDNPDRDDWDELLAANRALIKAMETGEPMTQNNARIIAEYLREAGWRERAIGAATKPALTWNLLADRGRHEDDPIGDMSVPYRSPSRDSRSRRAAVCRLSTPTR